MNIQQLGEGRIGGHLAIWGDPSRKDLQGEYFTPDTDFMIDWYDKRPVLYQHGIDNAVESSIIGHIVSMKMDDTGLWVEAQLDLHSRWARGVMQMIKKGVIRWSSGALPHLVRTAPDGKIIKWPIVEGSLTPTPAEPRQSPVVPLKHAVNMCGIMSAYKSSDLTPPDELAALITEDQAALGDTETERETDDHHPNNSESPQGDSGEVIMSGTEQPDLTAAAIANAVQEELDRRAAESARKEIEDRAAKAADLEARNAELEAQLAAKAEQTTTDETTPARRLPGETAPAQSVGKAVDIRVGDPYADLTTLDMMHGYVAMRGAGVEVSERYAKAMTMRALNDESVVIPDGVTIRAKSDELMGSTIATQGDEWVPDMWSAELWRLARLNNNILPLMRAIEMPSNPYELPIEGADPTVSYVSETVDEASLTLASSASAIPGSVAGTGKVTLTAKKLALRVGFSSEFVEDSIIPVIPQLREQAVEALTAAIDNVLLNGDTVTAGTGNINSDDGAPTAGDKYLAMDTIRKLWIVTTSANAIDASGSVTLNLIRQARFAMAGKYSVNPENLALICDAATYAALLKIDEVLTLDKFGPQATVLRGQLASIDGMPVVVSAEAGLTEADGKMSTTGSNNTKGQLSIIYRPGWIVGYRRRIAANITYLPYYDAYQMTATVRLACINRTADVASGVYNITV